MDEQIVESAVVTIRAMGARPSVRKIQHLIGGSHRDILAHMRKLFPETQMEDEEVLPSAPPEAPVAEIAAAQQALRAAEKSQNEAGSAYRDAAARLRGLRDRLAKLPQPTAPEEIPEYLAQEEQLRQEIAWCAKECEALKQMAEERRQVADQCRATVERLQVRARSLPDVVLRLQGDLRNAQRELHEVEREAERRLEAGRNRVVSIERTIAECEQELVALTGHRREKRTTDATTLHGM